jgi:HK97 family phage major capsid protein
VNAATKEKVGKLETVRMRARTILSEYEKTGLPAEQDLALTALLDEAKSLQTAIDTETKLDDKKRDLADLDRYLDEPARRIPHGVNGGDHPDERKSLQAAGWEFKAGMAYKTTSIGVSVPMFSEEVLFGEVPTQDASTAEFYRTTRAAMSEQYKTAYEHLIRLTARAQPGAAFSMLTAPEQKALSEGTDTAGGFIVPPDIQAEMLARAAQMAIMRQNCRVVTTNRDILRYPAVAPNSGTYGGISGGSIYSSGFVGGWVGETPAFSDTDPAFKTLDIPVRKLRVATRLSNDFVSDAAVNILAWLAQNGAENMALTEDQGLINGDGSALQPLGLLNAITSTVDVEGTTSNTITNTTSDLGSAKKLISNVAYALPAQYVSRAKWIMRRTIEGKIRALVDGSGRFLWPPFTGSGFASTTGEPLLGFPVLHSDWVPDDGTDANPVVVLADLSNYIIAQRTQVTSVVLRERFADSDQVGIILFERLGGNIFNTDAVRVGVV